LIAGRRNGAARRRCGFTLAEVIVTVAVVVTLAAIAIPTIMSRLAVGRGNAMSGELASLGAGMRAFNTNVGTFPKNLADLAASPATPLNYCGLAITPTNIAKWRGPYVSRFITGNYVMDNATVVNVTTYTAGPPPFLQITINNLTSDLARAIEEATDGPVVANSFTTGSFTYAAPNGTYRIPVRAC
jgi:prepilin-type N-terminal cleavage/methylation domain-containing protein